MKGSSVFIVAALLPSISVTAACCNVNEGVAEALRVRESVSIDGLHAPWDGLDDRTSVRIFSDSASLYFLYEVQDTSLTLVEDFKGESDVEPEDRVEVFFSPGPDMELYYCAEIDPLGRVLDYSCRYPSQMDYGWDFSTLEVLSGLKEVGYTVAFKVSKSELVSLGVDLSGFYIGIFRADFRPDGTVNWYSHVESDDEAPNFHQPKMLFPAEAE